MRLLYTNRYHFYAFLDDFFDNEFFGQAQDTVYGTKKAGIYTFVINPDGSTNINVYYARNTYLLNIFTNQYISSVGQSNPSDRKYQVGVLLSDPINSADIDATKLKDGINDAGGSATNTGLGTFMGWFNEFSMHEDNMVSEVSGEVSKDENL